MRYAQTAVLVSIVKRCKSCSTGKSSHKGSAECYQYCIIECGPGEVENESGTCTPCPYPQACDGCGCSDGYIGELCQTCAPGFFADNNECIQCPDNIPIVVASLLVSILILGILLYFLTKRLINYSGFASIMIAHSRYCK